MEIIVEPAPGHRYHGALIIDGEVVETAYDKRPGCCVRSLMNKMMLMYGKPTDQVKLEISGW